MRTLGGRRNERRIVWLDVRRCRRGRIRYCRRLQALLLNVYLSLITDLLVLWGEIAVLLGRWRLHRRCWLHNGLPLRLLGLLGGDDVLIVSDLLCLATLDAEEDYGRANKEEDNETSNYSPCDDGYRC